MEQKETCMNEKISQNTVKIMPEKLQPGYFHDYFHGRDDLYEKKTPAGHWYLPCANRFEEVCAKNQPGWVYDPKKPSVCKTCPCAVRIPLDKGAVTAHLRGEEYLGIFPLLENGASRILAFDFSDMEAESPDPFIKADWIEQILQTLQLPFLKERTENGARIWLFFDEPVPAGLLNEFGTLLLLKGMENVFVWDVSIFDAMVPFRARMKDEPDYKGPFLSLPLQGSLIHEGKSVFVDKRWQPYLLQWQTLRQTKKIPAAQVEGLMARWKREGTALKKKSAAPAPAQDLQLSLFDTPPASDPETPAPGFQSKEKQPVHLSVSKGLEIDALFLPESLKSRLFLLGCYANPAWQQKNQKFAAGQPRMMQLSRWDEENQKLTLPPVLLPDVKNILHQEGYLLETEDRRSTGRRLDAQFLGELRPEQKRLLEKLTAQERGILSAATGSGKTVMGIALTALKNCSTLILVESSEIARGWLRSLESMLDIEAEPDELRTKSGRRKQRTSKFGLLGSGSSTLGGLVDVAMIQSLEGREDLEELLSGYGMILADECHHAAAPTWQKVLSAASGRYVYGLSATPERIDGLTPSITLQLGDIQARYTSAMQKEQQDFERYFISRNTAFCPVDTDSRDFMKVARQASEDGQRNALIGQDVKAALARGRTPVILTQFVSQAKELAQMLEAAADEVFLMIGEEDRKAHKQKMDALENEKSAVVIGTMKCILEGFDFPRLDTLFLAAPVKSYISISQALGRIHRSVEGKTEVFVIDYVDERIPMLKRMFKNRLKEYQKQGYTPYKETRTIL